MKPDIVDKLEVRIGPFSQNTFMEILYWAMLSFVRGRISPGRAVMKYAKKHDGFLSRDAKPSDSPWTLSLIYKSIKLVCRVYKDRKQIS